MVKCNAKLFGFEADSKFFKEFLGLLDHDEPTPWFPSSREALQYWSVVKAMTKQ